jgi:hypothetical protein
MYRTAYRTVDVSGLSVFYRAAGPQDAPAILIADLTRRFLQRRDQV